MNLRDQHSHRIPSRGQVGRDGPHTLGDVGKTGLYNKKYLNMTTIVAENTSDQNYMISGMLRSFSTMPKQHLKAIQTSPVR